MNQQAMLRKMRQLQKEMMETQKQIEETLEDAIAAVVNQLLNDIDKMTEEKMSKYQAMAGLF